MTTVSTIIPVLNEEATLGEVVKSLVNVRLPRGELDIIIVDDGSQDSTPAVIAELQKTFPTIRALRHSQRLGKGAAVRTGIKASTGDIIVIQDADLEYQPADIPRLIGPIMGGLADVVYGSRFTSPERRVNFFWNTKANQVITFLTNLFYDANFTDVYTGYKAIRRSFLAGLKLESNSFTIEIELTAKLRRRGARFYEVPISYHARTYEEGKKIKWRDGIMALSGILYHRFSRMEEDSHNVAAGIAAGRS